MPVQLVGGDSDNRLRVAAERSKEGEDKVFVSHNFCDKCSWYQNSTLVSGEALSDSGDGLTFNSQNDYWIDLDHGRVFWEDNVPNHEDYIPVIKVDGQEKTERAPFSDGGGDYEIDYENGDVSFYTTQSGTVTADYYIPGGTHPSLFTFAPQQGKKLWIVRSEVQFTSDIVMNDAVHYQPYVYNPYDLPNKIPYGDPHIYKNVMDLLNEANGAYPSIPALGGSSRGISHTSYVFPFDYGVVREVPSSAGAEIRLRLQDDIAYAGEFCTITFYCTELDE